MESDPVPPEELDLSSKTENDLLSMINDQLSEQLPMSGMSLEDLRHLPSNDYHSAARQQNGSVATGRPQSYSDSPSNDGLPSWSSLAEREAINFNRTMSTNTS